MTTMAGMYVEFKAKAEETDKAFAKINSQFNSLKTKQDSASAGFTNMGNKISTAFKLIAGAFVLDKIFDGFSGVLDKINDTQEAIDKLTDSARGLGVVASELQSMAFAAKLSGVGFETLEGLINKTNKTVANAANGNATLSKDFDRLGLSMSSLKNASVDDQFKAIIASLGKMSDGVEKNKIAYDFFGKSAANALKLARDGYGDNIKLAGELGIVLTKSQRQAVDAFGDSKDKISAIWEGLWEKITAYVSPAFTAITDGIADLIKKFGGIDSVAQGFAKAIVSGVEFAIDAISGLIGFIDGLYARMLKIQIFALETANKAEKFNVLDAVAEKTGLSQQGAGAQRQYERTDKINQLYAELGVIEKEQSRKEGLLDDIKNKVHSAGEAIGEAGGKFKDVVENSITSAFAVFDKASLAVTNYTDTIIDAATKLSNTQLGGVLGLNKDSASSSALDQNIQNIYLKALKGTGPGYNTWTDEQGNMKSGQDTYERQIAEIMKQALSTFNNDPAALTKYLGAIKELQNFTKDIDPKDQKFTFDINITADAGLKASVATSSEVANAVILAVTNMTAKAASRGAR